MTCTQINTLSPPSSAFIGLCLYDLSHLSHFQSVISSVQKPTLAHKLHPLPIVTRCMFDAFSERAIASIVYRFTQISKMSFEGFVQALHITHVTN